MNRILLRIGGVVNAFFVIFHVWLGYRIHTSPGIAAGDRPLMEMLNVGRRADHFAVCHQFIMLCAGNAGDEAGADGAPFCIPVLWFARGRGDRYLTQVLAGDLHSLYIIGRLVPGFIFQDCET